VPLKRSTPIHPLKELFTKIEEFDIMYISTVLLNGTICKDNTSLKHQDCCLWGHITLDSWLRFVNEHNAAARANSNRSWLAFSHSSPVLERLLAIHFTSCLVKTNLPQHVSKHAYTQIL
jgi:hypothetical protein